MEYVIMEDQKTPVHQRHLHPNGDTQSKDNLSPEADDQTNRRRRKSHDSEGGHDEPDGLRIEPAEPVAPKNADFWQTVAGIAGNVLEWYDFAVFGYFVDIIGDVFFPPKQDGNAKTVEAFAVFGGAFLMRPIGGCLLGYIGDVYGRKKALVLSIFLMAFPTFAMGCLPTYEQVGAFAIVLLVIVRMLQGLSVGGQLMSSLVFTLESHDPSQWGLYGSYVMAAANFGTLLGSLTVEALRNWLTQEQLESWGWRIPFWAGILVSFCGFYLRSHGEEEAHHAVTGHVPVSTNPDEEHHDNKHTNDDVDDLHHVSGTSTSVNPLRLAFARENLRSLAASSMVPMLWSAGFYLCFVWLADYMNVLIESRVPHALAVNSFALLFSVCLFFPVAGLLSDRYGRISIMTIGGVSMGLLSPLLVALIGRGNTIVALFSQLTLGISLSFWGSPMCAWLVEAFDPASRLTSVSIGYNIAQATAGGLSPPLATWMVKAVGPSSPGLILTGLAIVALLGLLKVAPPPPATSHSVQHFDAVPTESATSNRPESEMVDLSRVELSREDHEML